MADSWKCAVFFSSDFTRNCTELFWFENDSEFQIIFAKHSKLYYWNKITVNWSGLKIINCFFSSEEWKQFNCRNIFALQIRKQNITDTHPCALTETLVLCCFCACRLAWSWLRNFLVRQVKFNRLFLLIEYHQRILWNLATPFNQEPYRIWHFMFSDPSFTVKRKQIF